MNVEARPSMLKGELVKVKLGARPSVLKGELVGENRREELFCLRSSEGLVTVRARPSVLRGELVSENNKEEPVSL